MKQSTSYKNIAYQPEIIQSIGDIALDAVIYKAHEDFKKTILFLQIQPENGGNTNYTAQLFIKSPNSDKVNLQSVNGQPLLIEEIKLEIPQKLLRLATDFQHTRHNSAELLRVISRYKKRQPEELENQLSEDLMKVFFTGDIGTVCRDFIDLLHQKKINELLLVIASESETIRNIPWEIIIHKLTTKVTGSSRLANDCFGLIRSTTESFKRFNLKGRLPTISPLKLLFITALPENLSESSKMLEIEDEQRKLIEAIGGLEAIDQPKIVIEFLDNASLKEIDTALKARKHDIVHISGHGSFDEKIQQGILYLEDEDGNESLIKGKQLGQLLSHHKCIRLLLLSACETAVAGKGGTCEQLAQYSGIPAILGMRFAVTDLGAKKFTTTFYKRLAKGETITNAIAESREVLWQYIQNQRKNNASSLHIAEWFTPVLYQNQYVASLTLKNKYDENIRRNFYPKLTFLKSTHTKLVGQGFIGRKAYLIRLRRAFASGQPVCLHGLGGLGKTTLAEAFSDSYRKRFGHTIFIFRGGAEINEKVILDELFWAYEESLPEKRVLRQAKNYLESNAQSTEKLQLLIDNYLKGRKTIFIFDNFEDVQQESEAKYPIADSGLHSFMEYLVLHKSNNCQLLFTTRYTISGLEQKILHFQLDKMSYAEQYRYMNFSEILRDIPMQERQILYRRLDGHPRSLEYLEGFKRKSGASNWLVLKDYIQKVENKVFDNLLLEKIYNLLPENERLVLQQAAVLINRSPITALTAISSRPEKELVSLVQNLQEWSLCVWDNKKQTLEVHTLIREWLKQQKQFDEKIYKKWVLKAGNYFMSLENDKGTIAISNLISAKEYFEIAYSWDNFSIVTLKLIDYYKATGFLQKALVLNQKLLEKPLKGKYIGKAYKNFGHIYNLLGEYEKAIEYYYKSRDKWDELDEVKEEGEILNGISQIYWAQGLYDKAISCLLDSLKKFRKNNNKQGEGVALNNLSQSYHALGRFDEAMDVLQKALVIRREIGDRRGEGITLNNIARIYDINKNHDKALETFSQSLKIHYEVGNQEMVAVTLSNISIIYIAKQKYETAISFLKSALKIQQELGFLKGESITLLNLGSLYSYRKENEIAINYFEQSYKIASTIGDYDTQGKTLHNIGVNYYNRFNYKTAAPFLLKALILLRKLGSPTQKSTESYLSQIILNIGEEEFQEIIKKYNKK